MLPLPQLPPPLPPLLLPVLPLPPGPRSISNQPREEEGLTNSHSKPIVSPGAMHRACGGRNSEQHVQVGPWEVAQHIRRGRHF